MAKLIIENSGYGSHTFHLGKYKKDNLGKNVFNGEKIVIVHGENAIDKDVHEALLSGRDERGNLRHPRYSKMFGVKDIAGRGHGFKVKVSAEDYPVKSKAKKVEVK